MTSLKQIEANRRNADHSTGPSTPEGKLRSRGNAVRHGLTAETVISTLEDAEDYQDFELAITSDYEAQTAVERELVLRLASLLWRLRRATAIETALFEEAARQQDRTVRGSNPKRLSDLRLTDYRHRIRDMARCFLRVLEFPNDTFPLLTRYEHTLWRQARQSVLSLESLRRRQYANRRQSRAPFTYDSGYSAHEISDDHGRSD